MLSVQLAHFLRLPNNHASTKRATNQIFVACCVLKFVSLVVVAFAASNPNRFLHAWNVSVPMLQARNMVRASSCGNFLSRLLRGLVGAWQSAPSAASPTHPPTYTHTHTRTSGAAAVTSSLLRAHAHQGLLLWHIIRCYGVFLVGAHAQLQTAAARLTIAPFSTA